GEVAAGGEGAEAGDEIGAGQRRARARVSGEARRGDDAGELVDPADRVEGDGGAGGDIGMEVEIAQGGGQRHATAGRKTAGNIEGFVVGEGEVATGDGE